MAAEINAQLVFSVIKGNLNHSYTKRFSADQITAFGGGPGAVSVSTTYETVSLADYAAVAHVWVLIENIDSTNSVGYGLEVAAAYQQFGVLAPGEFNFFKFDSTKTLALKTATGTCNVFLAIYDE